MIQESQVLSRCIKLGINIQRRSHITHNNYESDIWLQGQLLDNKVFYSNPSNDFYKYPIKLEHINYRVLHNKALSNTNYNNTLANDIDIDSLIIRVYRQHDIETTGVISMDELLHMYIGDEAHGITWVPCLVYETCYKDQVIRSLISNEFMDYGNLKNRGYSNIPYHIHSYGYHENRALEVSIDSICLSTPNGFFISDFNNIMIANTPRMVVENN